MKSGKRFGAVAPAKEDALRPVKRGVVPPFMKDLLKPYCTGDFVGEEAWMLVRFANQPWFDHWGTAWYDGVDSTGRRYSQELLVSEPYALHADDLKDVFTFADRFNLSFTIHADSQKFPTQTLRVVFEPNEEGGEERDPF